MDRLKVITVLAGISLIVTVVLYLLFDNSAVFVTVDKTTKLGGAVAFFLILFMAETCVYRHLRCDPLASVRKTLSGKWKLEAEIKGTNGAPPKTHFGTADIQQSEEGKITIIGRLEGRSETWEADEVVLTDSKLVYFFEVPVLQVSGVTNLRFTHVKKALLSEMNGYWILAGQEGRGSVKFTRIG